MFPVRLPISYYTYFLTTSIHKILCGAVLYYLCVFINFTHPSSFITTFTASFLPYFSCPRCSSRQSSYFPYIVFPSKHYTLFLVLLVVLSHFYQLHILNSYLHLNLYTTHYLYYFRYSDFRSGYHHYLYNLFMIFFLLFLSFFTCPRCSSRHYQYLFFQVIPRPYNLHAIIHPL